MIDTGVRISGLDNMFERLSHLKRLALGLPRLIPVVPAPNRHKTRGIQSCDIGIVGIFLIQ